MIEKRSCHDEIPVLGATVEDFWAWAYSDILNYTDRAVFAEYVVGMALGVTDAPRVEWDAVDLQYGGKTIEVKSSPTSRIGIRIRTLLQRSLSTYRRDSLGMRRPIPTRWSRAELRIATCSAYIPRSAGAELTSSILMDGTFAWFLPR
jgi:hypothetical protein